ncbi:MAG: hypothetical protein CMF96_12680 [Candidatus Marinimicrobia bacterium]|nr:hypothetical protein [Candidatus Neomarinimicrobiota bacterium]
MNTRPLVLFFIFLILFLYNCAAIGPASGGKIDKEGPKLLSISPANGTKNLNLNQNIVLTFSEPVDPNSVKASIRITPKHHTKLNIRRNIITIIPVLPWDRQKNIRISIERNIRDYQNNGIDSAIEIVYSPTTNLYFNNLSGKLHNIINQKVYNVGLFNYPIEDSLKLIYKTQSNKNGEFNFDYINENNYIIIATDGNVDNIYKSFRFHTYGMNTDEFIKITKNDSIHADLYIDEALVKLNISNGKFLGNNYGELNYSNGEIEKFYFSTDMNTIYPKHLKINKISSDSILIKSILNNRLSTYTTSGFKLLNSIFNDTIAPTLILHEYNNNEYHLNFDEPILMNKNINNIAYYYDVDSSMVPIYFLQETPFNIRTNHKINSNQLHIKPNSILDYSSNVFNDSLETIIINQSITSQPTINNSFGQLSGKINNINSVVMVEAKNNDSGIKYYTKSEDNIFLFKKLDPGEYFIRAFEILNDTTRENIYYSGNIKPYSRAAKFALHPSKIDIRARWEIEGIEINFNEE